MHAHVCSVNTICHARPQRSENEWMSFTKPGTHTKGEIRRAGEAIAKGVASRADEQVLQEWRDCHAYVLNTFQQTLRRWIRNRPYVLVQRLKRLNTVKDKLRTGRATDVATMNDLAGCRLIFPSVPELISYRDEFHSKSRAEHHYLSGGKFNYLGSPKATGYRGMHDVFRYNVQEPPGEAWNGLRVEIQYRTQAQHAWATAVEISDLIDGERVKFDRGANVERERLFVLASEYIARNAENMKGALPELSDAQVLNELVGLEHKIGVFGRLRALSAGAPVIPKSKNLVLCFSDSLEIIPFRSGRQALARRNQIELDSPDLDVVYIRAEKPHEVAGAFRNYFRDAQGFLDLLPAF